MSIFAFIGPYKLLTLKKKMTFHQLFSRPGPYAPYVDSASAFIIQKGSPFPVTTYIFLPKLG